MKAHLVKNEVSRLLEFVSKVKITHQKSGEIQIVEKSKRLSENKSRLQSLFEWMVDRDSDTVTIDDYQISFEPEWRTK
jgi:hypothetical protein